MTTIDTVTLLETRNCACGVARRTSGERYY